MLKAALDTIGYFWLPSAPKRQVAGRLLFDAKQQRLDLLGSLEGEAPIGALVSEAPGSELLIQGRTLKGRFTLVGCQHRNTIPLDLVSTSYYVGTVLTGTHNARHQGSIGFNEMEVSLNSLGEWVGTVNAEMSMQLTESGYSDGITINYKKPVVKECKFRWGKVALIVNYTVHMFGNQMVTPNYSVRITLNKRRSLADLRRLRSAIQTLVTVGTNAPVLIENVQVGVGGRKSTWHDYSRGDDLGEVDFAEPHRYLFAYSDIGGIKGVAKWLNSYLDYERPINSLVSHHYISQMYPENQYVNLVMAIEGMAVLKDSQYIRISSVKRRIEFIAQRIYQRFGDKVFGDISSALKWTNLAVDMRNKWAAHGGKGGDVDYKRMMVFAESIYYFALIWLLAECKIPKSAITRIQEGWGFREVIRQIENYLNSGTDSRLDRAPSRS